jgi:hypothetical protein
MLQARAGARIVALQTQLSAPADVLHPLGIDALLREHVNGTRESYTRNWKASHRPRRPARLDASAELLAGFNPQIP